MNISLDKTSKIENGISLFPIYEADLFNYSKQKEIKEIRVKKFSNLVWIEFEIEENKKIKFSDLLFKSKRDFEIFVKYLNKELQNF